MSLVYETAFLFLLFSHLMLLVLVGGGDGKNEYKGECPSSFSCGYLDNITFPFTTTERPDCGLLPIHNCHDDPNKPKMIQLQDKRKLFGVVRLSQFPKTCLFRDMNLYTLLQSRNCQAFRYNYTLPSTTIFHFVSLRIESTATMFSCNRTLHVSPSPHLHNYTNCTDFNLYYNPLISADNINASSLGALASCTKVQLPIKDVPDAVDPFTFITADISTEVKLTEEYAICYHKKRGRCQLDSRERFYCDRSKTGKMPIAATVTMAVVGVIVLGLLAYYYCFTTKISPSTFLLFKKENPTHRFIEEFLKEFGPFPTTRYSYSDLKKITNSFKNKLGQGGYGSVYKGKLHDGSTVAVKVLSELKGSNGEDFINEVVSISRTSHVNIVRLLGFCLDGSKKALIYEFMLNGSLEKFIYEDKHPLKDDRRLDCKTLYDIAIGVARGLEYLHRGCNTRILHFDIKPHNILLDGDLCPKISDFGLAKICPPKESIVSMFGPRGTPGYIAPELISRDFGGVSHKSDVYSYGMMVMEMVGRRKNIKVEVDCSSELYFPHWIYKRIELNQDLGLRCIENEIDEDMIRKMTVVSLWCIQTNPSKRPAMHKVVEMLEGSLQLLEVPPKPYLSSPSTSPTHLSSNIL